MYVLAILVWNLEYGCIPMGCGLWSFRYFSFYRAIFPTGIDALLQTLEKIFERDLEVSAYYGDRGYGYVHAFGLYVLDM